MFTEIITESHEREENQICDLCSSTAYKLCLETEDLTDLKLLVTQSVVEVFTHRSVFIYPDQKPTLEGKGAMKMTNGSPTFDLLVGEKKTPHKLILLIFFFY